MATRIVKTVDRGGGTFDLVAADPDGSNETIIQADFGAALSIGPAMAANLASAGLGDGIAWTSTELRYDTAVVSGANETALGGAVKLHNPADPAPPNELDDLIAFAQTKWAGRANMTTADAQTLIEKLEIVYPKVSE